MFIIFILLKKNYRTMITHSTITIGRSEISSTIMLPMISIYCLKNFTLLIHVNIMSFKTYQQLESDQAYPFFLTFVSHLDR